MKLPVVAVGYNRLPKIVVTNHPTPFIASRIESSHYSSLCQDLRITSMVRSII